MAPPGGSGNRSSASSFNVCNVWGWRSCVQCVCMRGCVCVCLCVCVYVYYVCVCVWRVSMSQRKLLLCTPACSPLSCVYTSPAFCISSPYPHSHYLLSLLVNVDLQGQACQVQIRYASQVGTGHCQGKTTTSRKGKSEVMLVCDLITHTHTHTHIHTHTYTLSHLCLPTHLPPYVLHLINAGGT
jgi:hypothetical protein